MLKLHMTTKSAIIPKYIMVQKKVQINNLRHFLSENKNHEENLALQNRMC